MHVPRRSLSAFDVSRRTLLSEFLHIKRGKHRPTPARLAVDGFVATSIGILVARQMDAGVFSLFLSSAALSTRFEALLKDNKEAIWTRGERSWAANKRSASCVLALFVGMAFAFVATVIAIGAAEAESTFKFALDAAAIGRDTILTRRFGSGPSLLAHNFVVFTSCFALAFVYRSYGALLALSWNACVWGVAFSFLIGRALEAASAPIVVGALALSSVLPHLLLEALSYVVAALVGIFTSKALSKYSIADPKLKQVMRASATLAVGAALVLCLAALLEAQVSSALLVRVSELIRGA